MKHLLRSILEFLASARRTDLKSALARYQADSGAGPTLALIRAYQAAGQTRLALGLAAQAHRRFPDSERIRTAHARARILQARSLLRDAIAALRVEHTAENYLRVADLYRALGKRRRALKLASAGQKRFPNHWATQFCLGKIHYYEAAGNPEKLKKALGFLLQARELNGEHYNTLILLAITLSRLNSYEQCRSVLFEILEQVPEDPKALQLLAQVDRLDRAAKAARAAQGPGMTVTAPKEDTHHSRRLRELMGKVPAVVGAYCFDVAGEEHDELTRPNGTFDFADRIESIRALASTCHFDAERIGVGALLSCTVRGDGWSLCMLPQEETDFVAFCEGSASPEELESEIRGVLEGSPATAAHA